jgi:hypothetical protein
MQMISHNTLVVGDSMARQFLITCVHLNRRGRAVPPVLDATGGHNDWWYGLEEGRRADSLQQLAKRSPVRTPGLMLSFQTCAAHVDFTRPVVAHDFRPRQIVLFAPVYWHSSRGCGQSDWNQWAWDLLARANTTRPPGFDGPVHLVIPPLGNVQEPQAVTRVLNAIIRPWWGTGHVYEMEEGAVTWSEPKGAYTNWHTMCSLSYDKYADKGSLHLSGTRDGRCTGSVNDHLLSQLDVSFRDTGGHRNSTHTTHAVTV